jgi:hypothetical protein
MVVVGYSDVDGVFIVRNSWGKDWGELDFDFGSISASVNTFSSLKGIEGNCYMPYNYLMSEEFGASDAWTLQSAKSIIDYKDGWAKRGKKGKAQAKTSSKGKASAKNGSAGKNGRAGGSRPGSAPINNAYVSTLLPGAVSILNSGRGVSFATNPHPATAYRGFVNDVVEDAIDYNEELPEEYLEIVEEFGNEEDEETEENEDEECEEVYVDDGGCCFSGYRRGRLVVVCSDQGNQPRSLQRTKKKTATREKMTKRSSTRTTTRRRATTKVS